MMTPEKINKMTDAKIAHRERINSLSRSINQRTAVMTIDQAAAVGSALAKRLEDDHQLGNIYVDDAIKELTTVDEYLAENIPELVHQAHVWTEDRAVEIIDEVLVSLGITE